MRPYGEIGGEDDDLAGRADTNLVGSSMYKDPADSTTRYVPRASTGGVDTGAAQSTALSGEVVDPTASDDPEEIRAGIEQTRAEMSDTLDAIQDKLNPQVLMTQAKDTLQDATASIMEQAKDTLQEATADILDNAKETVREVTSELVDNTKETVREATVGRVEHMVSNATDTAKDTGSNIVELAKQNPLPAAALGLGLAWFLSRNKGGSGSQGDRGMYDRPDYSVFRGNYGHQDYEGRNYDQGYRGRGSGQSQSIVDQVGSGIKQNPMPAALASLGLGWWLMNRQGSAGSMGSMGSTNRNTHSQYLSERYGSQGGAMGNDAGNVKDKIGEISGQVGDKAGDVADKMGDVVGQAGEAVGSAAGKVGETAGNVAGAVTHTAGNVAGGTGDLLSQLRRTVVENPVPAALAGASIAWLVMKNNSSGQRTLEHAGDMVSNVASGAGDVVSNVASGAGGVIGTVASSATDAVGSVAGAAGGVVGSVAGTAGDTVGNVAEGVKNQTQQAQSQFQRILLENPLAVGAAAAAIGVAVGLAVPETPQEHQLMGQARDNLLDKAQSVAQDTLQKVQQVTDEAGRTIEKEAQFQGLTQ